MHTGSRCQVYGTCKESLSEDICDKLDVPTKQVYFCPRGTFIQVELLDCGEISAVLLNQWQQLDVRFEGRIFRFDGVKLQSAPVEFTTYGATFEQEVSVAVRFVPANLVN